MANKIYSTLQLSRFLTDEDGEEFDDIFEIVLNKINLSNGDLVIIENESEIYCNRWKINNQSLYLNIPEYKQEFYFIESLIYLIDNFFNPYGISINGDISGYDDIFGEYFFYDVKNSVIKFDYDKTKYLEHFDKENDILNEMIKNMSL